MSKVKAITDFTRHTAAGLGTAAQTILERMQENAALFPDPPLSLADFGTLVGDYRDALVARSSNASADVVACRTARQALIDALRRLGTHVNIHAEGRPAYVEKSGFPTFSTRRPPDFSPPPAPQNLRLSHGPLSGTVRARFTPRRPRDMHEVQSTTGSPEEESGWLTAGYFRGAKALLKDLPPGALVWVRVRTVGLKGVMGPWSDPAMLRVL